MSETCSQINCRLPIQNKKYKLCKTHIWEKQNPGKSYKQEQLNKQKKTSFKMQQKQAQKPKKVYQFKAKKSKPKPVSDSRKELNKQYKEVRLEYLKEHHQCEYDGCRKEATEIHHKRGKQGYFNEFSKREEIPLLIDIRWFMAICRDHHQYVENHPAEAKEKGYSLSRLEK